PRMGALQPVWVARLTRLHPAAPPAHRRPVIAPWPGDAWSGSGSVLPLWRRMAPCDGCTSDDDPFRGRMLRRTRRCRCAAWPGRLPTLAATRRGRCADLNVALTAETPLWDWEGFPLAEPQSLDRRQVMNMRMGFIVLAAAVLPAMVAAQERGGCEEGFASVAQLPQRGWIFRNNSSPLGTTGWFQGIPARSPAQADATRTYLSDDKDNGGRGKPVVSTRSIATVVPIQHGGSLSFYTRSAGGAGSAVDRLQVLECQG